MKSLTTRLGGGALLFASLVVGMSSAREQYGPFALALLIVAVLFFTIGFCMVFVQSNADRHASAGYSICRSRRISR